MKQILLVTLDITRPSGTQELFEALKKQGRWWHYMKPTWLIYTDKSPAQVVDTLTPYIKGKGRILVTPFRHPFQGLLPKDAWEWIHKREAEMEVEQ